MSSRGRVWGPEKLELLRSLYQDRATNLRIADAVGLTETQVASKIANMRRDGQLVSVDRRSNNRGPRRRANPNPKWGGDGIRGLPTPPAEIIKVYEENGVTVTKYAPGYAIGAAPTPNVSNKE